VLKTKSAKTLEVNKVALERNALDDFRARLRGALMLPGEAGYDEARTLWNAMMGVFAGTLEKVYSKN
jgi:hypothetical protein